MRRRLLPVLVAIALAPCVAAAQEFEVSPDGPAALWGLDWDLLAGGAGNATLIRERWNDPTLIPPGRSWSGNQYSTGLVLRFAGWGRNCGLEIGASAEHGQGRFSVLACRRWRLSGTEPYLGLGFHYISAYPASSRRVGGLLTEELDLAVAAGARLMIERRPFLFIDCRYLGGGNFANDWPQDTFHKQHTVQLAGGFGITL